MKPYIFRALAGAAFLSALTACDQNYWNDHELDGFKEANEQGIVNKQTIQYTLTKDDYAAIADNKTNKTIAAAAGKSSELAALKNQCYFTEAITPNEYLPAFFASTSFEYYTLSNGSAIQLTYNSGTTEAATEAAAFASATIYTVSDENYRNVWGSEDNYVTSFAPSHTASASIPAILAEAMPDAEAGTRVVVTYNTSSVDPVFTTPDIPEEPGFVMSSVLGTASVGDELTVDGVVMALSTNGCILADNSGAIFVYNPTGLSELAIGDQITLNGTVSSYNKGLQIAAGATYDKVGSQEVTYPAPKAMDGAALDEYITRTTDAGPDFCTMTGKVAVSGKNINIVVEGAEKAQGSPYYTPDALKELLVNDAEVTVTGYIIAIAGGRYCSTVVTRIEPVTAPAANQLTSAATQIATEKESAVYTFNGSRWVAETGCYTLSHADYADMNQRYDNLSDELPEEYLPILVNKKFPYAQEGDTRYIVYFYYSSSQTSVRCMPFIYRGSEWIFNDGVVTESSQYVRADGKWMYDPNVEITLPVGKNIEISMLYYQSCVDWVLNNVPDGDKYVTSYGNNDYYTGASAYQNNLDLRADKARDQYAAAYADMTDEQVVETMKTRFAKEVFPAVLAQLNPDASPIPGFDVIYTINFYYYTGVTQPAVIRYKVTDNAKFEFVDCSWWNEEN